MKKEIALCITFLLLFPVLASGQGIIYSEKFRIKTGQEGDIISVPVSIKDVDDLYGYHIDVSYSNPSALSYHSLESGPFLSQGGASILDEDDLHLLKASSGSVKNIVSSRQGVDTGASGTGVLFTLRFNKELAGATSDLTIALSELSDPDASAIEHGIHYLRIWDGTDTSLKGPGESITFSATLKDSQNNPVAGTCKITVGGSTATMSLQAGIYTYSKSFAASGQYSWSVTCGSYYTVYDRVVVSECTPAHTRQCGQTDVGACSYGTQSCGEDGIWASECVGEIGPSPEGCDGKDNDCDGSVDEALSRACYSGAAGTKGIGVCHAGTQTCLLGNWGSCSGEVTPSEEVCDAGQLDENCDNVANEGCQCTQGETRECGSDVGACTYGLQTCLAGGTWGSECVGGTTPTTEGCDGKDNDCDGSVDEALSRVCYSGAAGTKGIGVCHAGTQTCLLGNWGSCSGEVTPSEEVCDAGQLDENCDNVANEGCQCTPGETQKCGSDVGACTYGLQTCLAGGAWGSECVGRITPTTEKCDGLDNDCDSTVDEDEAGEALAQACYTGQSDTESVGLCIAGTRTCMDGSYGSCEGEILPAVEACDDGLDNNCDGSKDEGCGCTPGKTKSCGSNVGECNYGIHTCGDDSIWGSECVGDVGPSSEVCDGKDNDCDGSVDEEACCEEDWGCDSWSTCLNNRKTRTCTDSNDCGTAMNKPETEADCSGLPSNETQDNGEEETTFQISTDARELQDNKVIIRYDNKGHPRRSGVSFVLQIKDLAGDVVAEESLGPVTIEADEHYQQYLDIPLHLLGKGEKYTLSAVAYENGEEIGVYETSLELSGVPTPGFPSGGVVALVIVAALALLLIIGFARHKKKGGVQKFEPAQDELEARKRAREDAAKRYIQEWLQRGVEWQHIKKTMLSRGWDDATLERLRREIG